MVKSTPPSGNASDEPTQSPAGAPPWQLPDNLVKWPGFALSWAAEEASQFYTSALVPLGITARHLGILTLLEAEGPLVQARIAERLHVVKPALVALLNELEAKGLVARRAHPTDKRAFAVHLLDAGRERIRRAEAVSRTATDAFFGVLSADERRLLHELLLRLAVAGAQRNATNPAASTEEA